MIPMIEKFVCVPVRIPMTIPMIRTSVPCFLVCTTSRGSGSQQNPGRVSGSDPMACWGAIAVEIFVYVMYPYECLFAQFPLPVLCFLVFMRRSGVLAAASGTVAGFRASLPPLSIWATALVIVFNPFFTLQFDSHTLALLFSKRGLET